MGRSYDDAASAQLGTGQPRLAAIVRLRYVPCMLLPFATLRAGGSPLAAEH